MPSRGTVFGSRYNVAAVRIDEIRGQNRHPRPRWDLQPALLGQAVPFSGCGTARTPPDPSGVTRSLRGASLESLEIGACRGGEDVERRFGGQTTDHDIARYGKDRHDGPGPRRFEPRDIDVMCLQQAQWISVLVHLAASVDEVPPPSQESVRKERGGHLHDRGASTIVRIASDTCHVDDRHGPVSRRYRHDRDRGIGDGHAAADGGQGVLCPFCTIVANARPLTRHVTASWPLRSGHRSAASGISWSAGEETRSVTSKRPLAVQLQRCSPRGQPRHLGILLNPQGRAAGGEAHDRMRRGLGDHPEVLDIGHELRAGLRGAGPCLGLWRRNSKRVGPDRSESKLAGLFWGFPP